MTSEPIFPPLRPPWYRTSFNILSFLVTNELMWDSAGLQSGKAKAEAVPEQIWSHMTDFKRTSLPGPLKLSQVPMQLLETKLFHSRKTQHRGASSPPFPSSCCWLLSFCFSNQQILLAPLTWTCFPLWHSLHQGTAPVCRAWHFTKTTLGRSCRKSLCEKRSLKWNFTKWYFVAGPQLPPAPHTAPTSCQY